VITWSGVLDILACAWHPLYWQSWSRPYHIHLEFTLGIRINRDGLPCVRHRFAVIVSMESAVYVTLQYPREETGKEMVT
jgi:hypothetical protein